ncbi:MAG: 16S rRNA methyltransferase [Euryarchaeota archaeon]|nr:16S rRNA methyltransferase [Euryarchaeota archaeon]
MLTIVLSESELERVPASLFRHQAIVSSAQRRMKKPVDILLDSNYHHSAMRNLAEWERRGRPDIVHLFLLVTLESIVNKKNCLRVIVHTRNDEMIVFNPTTRIMRNYDRFVGLMEQLFEKQVIPDEEKPLITLIKDKKLTQIVKQESFDYVIAFSSEGKHVNLPTFFTDIQKKKKENILCVIGGFPKGEFHNDVFGLSDEVVSIYPEMVPAWTVASEVVVNYENIFLPEKL